MVLEDLEDSYGHLFGAIHLTSSRESTRLASTSDDLHSTNPARLRRDRTISLRRNAFSSS